MEILLGTLNRALRLEQDNGSNSGGAIVAERVLKLMEIILHEASSEADTTEVNVYLFSLVHDRTLINKAYLLSSRNTTSF